MTSAQFRGATQSLLVALFATTAALSAQADGVNDHLTPLSSNTTAPSNWRIAPGQLFNGVAALDASVRLSVSSPSGGFSCSGSLLAGGAYILTAGHCADSMAGATMTVGFGYSNGASAFTRTATAADVTLHPLWQGFDTSGDAGSDLAIVKLSAPVTTINGYHLSSTNDLGKQMLIGGYGTTGTGGAASGPTWGDSRYGHYAFNTFDVDSKTLNVTMAGAAPDWQGQPASFYTGTTYIFDFDDAANPNSRNTLQRLADVSGNQWASGTGVSGEGMIAGGDSGGGDLVWTGSEWVLSAVHSWGWNVNVSEGDGACDFVHITDCSPIQTNGSSFGDLGGSTALFDQAAWISSVVGSQVIAAVPEPAVVSLWLAGLAGLVVRRRRTANRERR